MFLIDTNVISEARNGRRADAGVQSFWATAARDDTPLFLAAVTIGELRRGVELIRHRGITRKPSCWSSGWLRCCRLTAIGCWTPMAMRPRSGGDCECSIPTTHR
jgi:hypothetical protein